MLDEKELESIDEHNDTPTEQFLEESYGTKPVDKSEKKQNVWKSLVNVRLTFEICRSSHVSKESDKYNYS